jgi:methionyl-tRNA synthetase
MQAEFADFQKIELKTARIVEAERVPDTDKLLKLQLEVAGEPRQIVAGIAEHYDAETLVGRTIVIVANLKPAKIRGVESQGMLLAASTDDSLRLVTVDGEIPTGARVG